MDLLDGQHGSYYLQIIHNYNPLQEPSDEEIGEAAFLKFANVGDGPCGCGIGAKETWIEAIDWYRKKVSDLGVNGNSIDLKKIYLTERPRLAAVLSHEGQENGTCVTVKGYPLNDGHYIFLNGVWWEMDITEFCSTDINK